VHAPKLRLDGRVPVLLLDVMGTLVRDPFFEEMPAFFGLSLRELLAVKHPTAWVEFEHGAIDEVACMAKFFVDQRPFDVDAFKAHVADAYAWLPGVPELLADLQERGVEMHALSNYTPWYRLIEERLGLSRYVPWTFVSCETGVRKPHEDAYVGPASKLARPVSSCVFVDDRKDNVEAAWRVGMPGLVFSDAETLRRDLVELGIL
jgi:HAD superfamily hydrolase (TIGR01509 family)